MRSTPSSASALQFELKELHREVGITFVYVTHDQEEALTMSDRLAVMNEGQIEQIGAPQEVYDSPMSIYVADFLGLANLMPARVPAAGTVEIEGRGLAAPTGTSSASAPSSPDPSDCVSSPPARGCSPGRSPTSFSSAR